MANMNLTLDTAEHPHFYADYCPPLGVYDEMCSTPGFPRPHWEYVIRSLGALGTQELERRAHATGATLPWFSDCSDELRYAPGELTFGHLVKASSFDHLL